MDIQVLIPKYKDDIEHINQLKKCSYEQVRPFIPRLLECIQDLHWDIARPIAEYLQGMAHNFPDQIIEILKGNDEEWKYNCIISFGKDSTNVLLKNEIERIALSPTQREIDECVQEVAIETIEGW